MNDCATSPLVETERLRLRRHCLDDLPRRAAMTGNPHVMRHFGGATQDREENMARILRYVGHWTTFGYGLWVVEERATGRWVGEVGLAHFERGLGDRIDPFPEGAWMLDAWAEGHGFAAEAMRAAIDWHERTVGPARKVCIIAPGNAESLRLAAKLGFAAFDEAPHRGRMVTMLARPA